jgi:hypothetical protein
MEPFLRPMPERPGWLQQDTEANAEWLAFRHRVGDLGDENFSPTARRAHDAFWRAARPAFRNQDNRNRQKGTFDAKRFEINRRRRSGIARCRPRAR